MQYNILKDLLGDDWCVYRYPSLICIHVCVHTIRIIELQNTGAIYAHRSGVVCCVEYILEPHVGHSPVSLENCDRFVPHMHNCTITIHLSNGTLSLDLYHQCHEPLTCERAGPLRPVFMFSIDPVITCTACAHEWGSCNDSMTTQGV